MAKNNIQHDDWKSPMFRGLCPTEIDWARMAAFIDGEGSVLINPRRGSKRHLTLASGFYLKVTVANTDVRLLAWINQVFGGSYKDANTPSYYTGRNIKVCWHWTASANRAAWILHHCLPWFIIKKEQAEIGIKLQSSMCGAAHRGRGLPEHVVEERMELKRQLLVMKKRGRSLDPQEQQRIDEVS